MICDQLLNSLLMYACISSLLLRERVREGAKINVPLLRALEDNHVYVYFRGNNRRE
jgi:hypothetical protein